MTNWSKVEVIFSRNLHITPNIIDKLPFYRVEQILESYQEIVEEEKKAQESEERKQQSQIPSTTNYGGFQTPKMNIPKIEIPKMNIPKI